MAGLPSFDEQTVKQFGQAFEDLFYEGKGGDMAAYYTEDARLMADGIAPVQGRAAIETFWNMTCERGRALQMKRDIQVEEIRASEALSYAVSTLTVEVRTPDGKTAVNTVKDITIWRKQADGSWLIEVDISNQNPPPKPTPPKRP